MTEHVSSTNRRSFLQTALAAGGAAAAGLAVSTPATVTAAAKSDDAFLPEGATVLFQGDSITDAGRSRDRADEVNQQAAMGKGYAWMAAAGLLTTYPKKELQIYNRGISGNKVHQLSDRWQKDCIDLKPDVLSILIGVNDIWHGLNGKYDGTVKTYENDYRALLKRTREALPNVHLVICEPFVLRCGAVNDKWFPEFDGYREAARRVFDEQHKSHPDATRFVAFQDMFDEAVQYAPPEHWAGDGVHPSSYGASLMATAWQNAVR
ncbi:SGNH/GDSL hydrolase family protein [Rubinisphaera sp. JC750]|uniref:SGNH/GDSL hydrolase family protein n=1 Tax=Rubinisphaera sp. JC750 TaxID=2898658 RepID=UPI001F38B301|nr:SGNH/GDSL hydrolase family protein [Rubinisphaera sp. JC750]